MDFTNAICNDTEGYSKFVLPDYQYACDSKEHNDTSRKLNKADLPCCNVVIPDPKGKGSEHLLDEARKSFMSGHSSFSFYCATFLVIYLHARLSNDQVPGCSLIEEGITVHRRLLRYIIIFLLIFLVHTDVHFNLWTTLI